MHEFKCVLHTTADQLYEGIIYPFHNLMHIYSKHMNNLHFLCDKDDPLDKLEKIEQITNV